MKKGFPLRNTLLALGTATSLIACRADTTRGIQFELVDVQTGESVLRMETRNQIVQCLFDPKGILQKEL